MREAANRHGHSVTFQYPGAFMWTEEYAEKCKNKRSSEGMKKFTELYNEFINNPDLNKTLINKLANRFFNSGDQWPLFEKLVKAFHYKLFEGETFTIETGCCKGKHVWDVNGGKYRNWAWKYAEMAKEDIQNVRNAK